jgi:predicted branched-subunit amino acid permease
VSAPGPSPHADIDTDADTGTGAGPTRPADTDADTGTGMRTARSVVLRQAASVAVATGAYGVSFGALSVASGLSVAQTCALSLLMFTGGSQFAFVGVIGAGGGGIAAIATAGLLGVRNGFYGLQMSPLLQVNGLRRLGAAQLTIDESTAVGSGQVVTHPGRPELARLGFWATGAGVFALWNVATVIGALVGDALGDPRRYGLDAAAAAAFLALLWPRLHSARPRGVAGLGSGVAIALIPFAPAGVPVLAAALVAVVAGRSAPRPDPQDPGTTRGPDIPEEAETPQGPGTPEKPGAPKGPGTPDDHDAPGGGPGAGSRSGTANGTGTPGADR